MSGERKRFARRLIVLVNVAAALLMATLCAVGFLYPGQLGSEAIVKVANESGRAITLPLFTTEARLTFAFAVVVLIANALYVLYGRRARAPLRHIQSEAPGGPLLIAREAIESGLRAAGEALPEITRMRVAIENAGLKRIRVKAQFQAPEGASIHDASRNLRQALEQRFQEMVRLADGARVEHAIEFVGFAGKSPKKGQAPAPPPEPQDPFTGPRYPIDDEDPYGEKKRP